MGGPNDKSNQGPTGGDNNRERGIQASYQEAARRGALKNLATRQAEDKAEDDNPFAEIEEPKKAAKKAAPPKPDKDSDDLSSIIDDWDD